MAVTNEQRLLKQSIAMMLFVAFSGLVFGLFTSSQSILFDGIFSLVAAVIKVMMLITARLIAKESSVRFQFGFWHLEPMVIAFDGALMLLICIYALANGIFGLIHGGHHVNFGFASLYAAIISVSSLFYYNYLKRRNRQIGSDMLRMDCVGWLADGLLTLGLFCSFALAWLLTGTAWQHWTPFLDPAILVVVALIMLPTTARILAPALRDILRIVPDALDQKVTDVMDDIVARRGLGHYQSYVQKEGRARFIEIHVVLPPDYPLTHIGTLDEIRQEIADALGKASPQRWLTISFTGDEKWAC
ncbi:cation diffusion facilitator family transporter [Phytohalomonas tamaricis]|uniref:cation diffusion facilitator family transporter n=1 Tax=Phytohalomonas tamaricis TaxID=2081032 RepID=UPI000D0BA155|nr:cation transporter [Phytohalomonas tamaricis]